MKISKLFEKCKIGNLELQNRIIMPPCTTNLAQSGFVTERLTRHYEAIARGGVGMIIVEDLIVDSVLGRHAVEDLIGDDDKYVPSLAKFVSSLKAEGTKVAVHLNHGGRRAGRIVDGYLRLTKGKLPVAPSSLAHFEPGFVVPKELSLDEIEEIIEKYARAALRAKEAGFDAIGLHCSHGYLINQFLSPSCNKRRDEYGGNFNKRMRFVLEIISRIQEKIGKETSLFCRISGEEPWEGGLALEDMKQIGIRLEEAGIQAFVLSRGVLNYPMDSSHFIPSIAPMTIPRGCMVYLSEAIKKVVKAPVAIANRINDPFLAETILLEGKADLIGIGRGLIADPEFPRKTREGRFDEIRTCIACMECMNKLRQDDPAIACAVNAEIGRETTIPLLPAETPKKVLIIGGGPAGMEAARTARMKGHEVILFERSPQLGGALLTASIPPGRQEINELTRYLQKELKRTGVVIRTGIAVTQEIIDKESPDIIIAATGSQPLLLPIPGIDKEHVMTAAEVLHGAKDPVGKVIVLGGGLVGAEVAEYLAIKGKDVALVEMTDQIASDAQSTVRSLLILSLREKGVKIWTRTKVEAIISGGVVVTKSGKRIEMLCDNAVLAFGSQPDRSLSAAVATHSAVWIGDCVKPRKIIDAIRDGFEAGANIK